MKSLCDTCADKSWCKACAECKDELTHPNYTRYGLRVAYAVTKCPDYRKEDKPK